MHLPPDSKNGDFPMTIWRKSSRSENGQNCVELAWRKSSRSQNGQNCVELSVGAIRDSKNTSGPTLAADITALVSAVKVDRFS
ncbi:DUF397 domain-containing protein [Actinokineospora sp. 24-640]